ncbi:hypothetical protein SCHPADRAFT_820405 [Schizopora paradoxa]|uniref:RFX-type winged-helix domain-containing protein n=1 Tax=Schizopora paradoxa TaxID=27342 RepID=A0A0H2S259_9AGAM|nr:hypothetical protein SCHPADRAFT_820405 [Schizopora paradoxa]
MLSSASPFDFLSSATHHPHGHHHHQHTRSASVSSSSSSNSRPHSSHAVVSGMPPEDIFGSPYLNKHHALAQPNSTSHTRTSSASTSSYASSLDTHLLSPADSPPNHNLSNPALKAHLRPSHTHIRAARAASSPYPRDAESVYSSSSETEDMSLFFNNHSPPEYNQALYLPGAPPHGTMAPSHDAFHAAGQFGRMTLTQDHALEQLAANVRAATTTSASDRAKQIFVQAWLNANYAPYPDGNVPRQGLYFSYRRVCDQYGIPHINTATLGKAIRLCFPTIKTRRLGVRGNSKYHYCGIRPTTATEIEWLQDYVRKSNTAHANALAARQSGDHVGGKDDHSDEEEDDEGSEGNASGGSPSKRNSLTLNSNANGTLGAGVGGGLKSPTLFPMDTDKTPTTNTLLSAAQAAQRPNFHAQATIRRHNLAMGASADGSGGVAQSPAGNVPGAAPFMGGAPQPASVRDMPHFPDIEEAVGSDSASPHGIAAREVWRWFVDHLNALLEGVRTLRFDQFELHLRTFWTSLNGDHREVVHAPAVAGLMAKADAMVYNEILEILRLQMLSPIPPAALSSLRQLADKMEKILLLALEGYGNTFVEPKVELGARFGHLVLRFLDIYQVTQALSTVLTNQKQLAEMRRSWQSIDFESVRNQSALVCNCRHEELVQLLEVDFVQLLNGLPKSSEPVGEVMVWADTCCERLMGGGPRGSGSGLPGSGEERSTLSSRSILIRWGYVTSQIMRDLTIRSDPAFGAFQILKLFLDDWIALNVLRSVALSTNSVAASVEPVIQQQFFTLSPMGGQEGAHANAANAYPGGILNDTPTTSSMLAALHDSFASGGLDGGVGGSGPGGFASDFNVPMAFVDSQANGNGGAGGAEQGGIGGMDGMFSDFGVAGTPFEVPPFTPSDLGVNDGSSSAGHGSSPSHSSPGHSEQQIKDETA